MTVLSDPVKNIAGVADVDGSGYFEVWTSVRDGGADGILTDTPVRVPITSEGITTPELKPGPAYYRLKLGSMRQSIEGRITIPATGTVRVMDVIAASILIPEDTPAQLVIQAVQSYLAANPPALDELPEYLSEEALANSYAPQNAYVIFRDTAGNPLPAGSVTEIRIDTATGDIDDIIFIPAEV